MLKRVLLATLIAEEWAYICQAILPKRVSSFKFLVTTLKTKKRDKKMIPVAAANTLTEYLTSQSNDPEEVSCPSCNRRLWRHGTHSRKCRSLTVCAVLVVTRLLCSRCGKTFSLLPSFLEPRKRYERAVNEEYVSKVMKNHTYREAAWSEEDGDNQDAAASLSRAFRAGERACQNATEHLLETQQVLLDADVEPEQIHCEPDCSSSNRARSQVKQRQLRVLNQVFALLQRWFGDCEGAICAAYRSLGLGFRLPTPHAMQHALF
jgi:transposase-like protein